MRHPQLSTADRRARPDGKSPCLVAVAHGSAHPGAAAAFTGLARLTAARASRRGVQGLQVRTAYLGHAPPSVAEVLEALSRAAPGRPEARDDTRPAAVVVPLLLCAAYHSEVDLPALLREASHRLPRLAISYGRPLGPHPALLRALERRLAEAGVPTTPAEAAETSVVLAAAGSSRPSANAAVARAAAAWRAARGWREVVPAYVSAAPPSPGQAVAGLLRAGTPRVVVASYLLAPGIFADQVRRQSLAAGAHAVSAALGTVPEVADVIVERYLRAEPLPVPTGAAAG